MMLYLIVTKTDADRIMEALDGHPGTEDIVDRLSRDTGADMQDIVNRMKSLGPCASCSIEGQQQSCIAWDVQKLGRRLLRLLKRARGEIAPGK